MTALASTAFLFVLMALELWRRPAGSVGAGMLLAVLLAAGVGLLCVLVTRVGRERRWVWSVAAAAPCALAFTALDTALRRAFQVDHGMVLLAARAAGVLIAALVFTACWRLLARAETLRTSVRAALCLCAAVGALLAVLVAMLPHMAVLAVYTAYTFLIGGFVSFATRFRRLTLLPGAIAFGLAAALGPVRYVELSAIFAWTAALTIACATHDFGLSPPRARPAVLAALCIACLGGAHLVTRHLPGAYSSARGSGVLSGLVHSAHVISDVDGDGYGAVFAHRDCAAFDARVAPHRHELIGNGIDDNCRRGDAGPDVLGWVREREAVQRPPPRLQGDLIVIMIDALRYDVAHSAHMKTLSGWAAEGVDFSRAHATSTFTASALGGILAGRHAASIQLRFYSRLSAKPTRPPGGLAPWLRKRGYGTALAGRFADTPLYDDDAYAFGFDVSEYTTQQDGADVVARAALRAWARMDPARPRFMFVHHMQVHRLEGRPGYEANARAVDESLAWLRQRIGEGVNWVVLSDHGEEFGEHGGSFHASTLYQEVVHIPLIFVSPGLSPARIDAVSSLHSLMPTLMAAFGAAPDPAALGPYLCLAPPAAGSCRDIPAIMSLELPDRHIHGLVLGHRKIISDVDRGHVEAYDLDADPGEKRPLDPIPKDLLDELQRWEEAALGPRPNTFVWPYTAKPPW